jgi:branched-chain amino acid transport system ATP-binding protein
VFHKKNIVSLAETRFFENPSLFLAVHLFGRRLAKHGYIIAPNGAGKTTLFASIAGFVKPSGGQVRFAGETITGTRPDLIYRRGLVRTFQVVRTLPELSVLQNVMAGAFLRTRNVAEARRNAEELLEFTGLAPNMHMLGNSLTIADKKRLEVARALATAPRLLMLDEPSLGLAPLLVAGIFEAVRAIRASGVTILLVEQNVREALALADRADVLQAGEVVLTGTGGDVAARWRAYCFAVTARTLGRARVSRFARRHRCAAGAWLAQHLLARRLWRFCRASVASRRSPASGGKPRRPRQATR